VLVEFNDSHAEMRLILQQSANGVMLKFKAAGFLIEILVQDHVSASKLSLKNMTAS
jgi:hypothetical protein